MRTMTAAATMVRLGHRRQGSQASQRPRTQQQARRQRSRSLERGSSEDLSDSPHMPAAAAHSCQSGRTGQLCQPSPHASVLTDSSKDSACYLKSLQMQQRCTVTGVHCVLQLPLLMKILLDSCMYVTMRIGLACCMLYLQVRPGTVD